MVAQTIVLDKSEGGNSSDPERGSFTGSTGFCEIKLKLFPLHFMLTSLSIKGFITDFMSFITVGGGKLLQVL